MPSKPTLRLVPAIERLQQSLGLNDRELCARAGVNEETWHLARTDAASAPNEHTLQKLLDALARAVADVRAAPWFISPHAMATSERRDIQRDVRKNNARVVAGTLRPAAPIAFAVTPVAWLQYQLALEIACRAKGLSAIAVSIPLHRPRDMSDVIEWENRLRAEYGSGSPPPIYKAAAKAGPTKVEAPPTRNRKASRARHVAIYICVEAFGTPQHIMADVVGMTPQNVTKALDNFEPTAAEYLLVEKLQNLVAAYPEPNHFRTSDQPK